MKVLIALATCNRPVITDICLRNLSALRGSDVRLVVYDDASDAYDKAYLEGFADGVTRFQSRGGIARSRARTLRDFVYRFTEFDVLYLTDNDTVHDPGFLDVLRRLAAEQAASGQPLPISLYNSVFHTAPQNIVDQTDERLITRSIPGVCHAYDRRIAQTIVQVLNHDPELDHIPGWDWHYVTLLRRPCILTRTSYLEHFARDRHEGGMHNASSGLGDAGLADFERDRAQNPTPWLQSIRPEVIRKLIY